MQTSIDWAMFLAEDKDRNVSGERVIAILEAAGIQVDVLPFGGKMDRWAGENPMSATKEYTKNWFEIWTIHANDFGNGYYKVLVEFIERKEPFGIHMIYNYPGTMETHKF